MTGTEYAIKFFLQEEAFKAEATLYTACFPSLRNNMSPSLLPLLTAPKSQQAPSHECNDLGHHQSAEKETAPSVMTRARFSQKGWLERISRGPVRDSKECCTASQSSASGPIQETRLVHGQHNHDGGGNQGESRSVTTDASMHSALSNCASCVADALPQMSQAAAKFLPRIEAVCDDAVDPRGRLLPPCIVMEKGESLQDWSNRAEPDLFASLAVCLDFNGLCGNDPPEGFSE